MSESSTFMDWHVATILRSAFRALSWIAGIGSVILMLPTLIDVGHRNMFGSSLPGFLEYSEVGLVFVIYLGMAGAMMDRTHIFTPVLTSRLSRLAGDIVRVVGLALVAVLLAVMVFGTTRVALESFSVREFRFGLVEVAIWPAKVAVSFGLCALLLEVGLQLIESIMAVTRRRCASRDA